MDFENKHGRVYTWEDFMPYFKGIVYRRWGQGFHPDLTEDSLQVAYMALLEKWVSYRKSILPNGNFNLELATTFALSRFWRNYYAEMRAPEVSSGEPLPDFRNSEDVEALCWMEDVGEEQLQKWFQASTHGYREPGMSERTSQRYKERARKAAKESYRAYQAMQGVPA